MPPVRSMRVNASIWAAKNIGQSHHTHNTERWRRKVFIEGTTYIHDKQTTILLAAFNIIVSCNRQCVIPVKAITLTVKSTLCFFYTFFSLSSKGLFFFYDSLTWNGENSTTGISTAPPAGLGSGYITLVACLAPSYENLYELLLATNDFGYMI